MAELQDDSRILVPFLPSLSHLAAVKVALSLFESLGGVKPFISFVENGKSTSFLEFLKKDGETNFELTMKNLAFIPALLRKRVLEAASGFLYAVSNWKKRHSDLFKLKKEKLIFHWNFDGTIDTVKIVQHLVQDETIDIRRRFELACKYGLEGNIRTLWAEMQESHQRENFGAALNPIEEFWVRWMRDGSRANLLQGVSEIFKNQLVRISTRYTRISPFFSLLQPEERQKILYELEFVDEDDVMLCAYSMSKEEEEKLLRESLYAEKVLELYLQWPLQSLFLEAVGKIWNYMNDRNFKSLLSQILYKNLYCKDFDYCELLEIVWNRSPNRLKERAKENPHLRKSIDLCLDEMRRRRKERKKIIDLCLDEIRRKKEGREKTIDLCLDENRESFNIERLLLEQKVNSDTEGKRKATRKNRGWHSKKSKKN